MIKFKSEQAYKNANALSIADQLAKEVSYTPDKFNALK